MRQDDLLSHSVNFLGDRICPDLNRELVALHLPGKEIRVISCLFPQYVIGFSPGRHRDIFEFLFHVVKSNVKEIPFILIPFQIIIAETLDILSIDWEYNRLDKNRHFLAFIKVLWILQVTLGLGEHFFDRL